MPSKFEQFKCDRHCFCRSNGFALASDLSGLLCEVCHHSGNAAGVSFLRAAEGIALNRHFQLRTVDGLTGGPAPLGPRVALPLAAVSGRELRQAVRLAPTPPKP